MLPPPKTVYTTKAQSRPKLQANALAYPVRDIVREAVFCLRVAFMSANKERIALMREIIKEYYPKRNTGIVVLNRPYDPVRKGPTLTQ